MQNTKFVNSTVPGFYSVKEDVSQDDILNMALQIAQSRLAQGETLNSPEATYKALQIYTQGHEREVFGVICLDNQHRIIAFEEMFFGSVDHVSLSPREIARLALRYNASAIVLFHNHPSGDVKPSSADKDATVTVASAMMTVGVRFLDHVIVSPCGYVSLAELGYV